jgi:hypothetical protein
MNTTASFVLAVLLVAPIGCSRGEPPTPSTSPSVSPLPPPPRVAASPASPTTALPIEDDPNTVPAVVGPMQAIPKDQIPSSVQLHGKVEHALRWTDGNGDNLAVFTRGESTRSDHASAYLDVQHIVLTTPARAKVLRSVRERVDDCDGELHLSYLDRAFAVTDLDHDGIGELTFAYVRACRTGTAPTAMKLLMLENGDKYILRGSMGGELRVDPSFTRTPAFVEHAKRTWQSVNTS